MSDLIRRQEAVDAVKTHYRICDDLLEVIAHEIEQLPSAEPEIIRCKDCEWWEKQENGIQGRCAVMRMYPAGGWYCGNARRRENNGEEPAC